MADTTLLVAEVKDVCGGRATIVGTRIEVRHVLGWMASGMTVGEIAEDYSLTRDQISACLFWAYGLVERHYGLEADSNVVSISPGPVVELHTPH